MIMEVYLSHQCFVNSFAAMPAATTHPEAMLSLAATAAPFIYPFKGPHSSQKPVEFPLRGETVIFTPGCICGGWDKVRA